MDLAAMQRRLAAIERREVSQPAPTHRGGVRDLLVYKDD